MAPPFLEHRSSLAHETGAHPEQAGRMLAIERELSARDWLGFERVQSRPVDRALLTRVHPEGFVAAIEALCARGGGYLDSDTLASEHSFEAALHAAGGAVQAVDAVLDSGAAVAFSAHRPPGHHALPTRAMGFCLFNNVAVAAVHALSRGLRRVMVFDWDVHHGNGTNDIFHASKQVLFVSIHQSPLYPGTGPATDVGSGEGEGLTVNLPVPPGAGAREFLSLTNEVAMPILRAYQPQLVLISAGYDAHRDDPLSACLMTEDGFGRLTSAVRVTCEELGVPVVAVLEGGYAPRALARSVAATLERLLTPGQAPVAEPTALAQLARAQFARWWPVLS